METITSPLSQYIANADFSSGKHQVTIHATPEAIWEATKLVTVPEIPIMRILFTIRSLPAMLTGKGEFFRKGKEVRPILEHMQQQGFQTIQETDAHLIFGVIGKFWKASDPETIIPESPEAYLLPPPSGYAKAIGYFSLEATHDGAFILTHGTSVFTPDPHVKRTFQRYWMFIYPGVFLIRRAWLQAIKKRAESRNVSL